MVVFDSCFFWNYITISLPAMNSFKIFLTKCSMLFGDFLVMKIDAAVLEELVVIHYITVSDSILCEFHSHIPFLFIPSNANSSIICSFKYMDANTWNVSLNFQISYWIFIPSIYCFYIPQQHMSITNVLVRMCVKMLEVKKST